MHVLQRKFHSIVSAAAIPVTLLLFFLLSSAYLFPQQSGQLSNPSDSNQLTIKLATIGPGDEVYSWWGHIALIAEDPQSGSSYLYDYGQFAFESTNFFRNFAMGKLLFSTGRVRTQAALRYWSSEGRRIHIQELNLSPEKEQQVFTVLENDHKPENRVYLYDHYYSNCSTRLRDIINDAVEGQFKQHYSEESNYSFRELSRRYSADHPLMDRILMFIMSAKIDTPVTEYEEMFLPDRLEQLAAEFSYVNEKGLTVPLVADTEIYSEAVDRVPVSIHPPGPFRYMIPLAVILVLLASFLVVYRHEKKRFFRRAYTLFTSLICFVFGVFGTALFFMSFFTDHWYTGMNENLVLFNPLLLVCFLFSLGAVREKRLIGLRFQIALFSLLMFAGIILVILKIIGIIAPVVGFHQQNWDFIMIAVPLYFFLGPFQVLRR